MKLSPFLIPIALLSVACGQAPQATAQAPAASPQTEGPVPSPVPPVQATAVEPAPPSSAPSTDRAKAPSPSRATPHPAAPSSGASAVRAPAPSAEKSAPARVRFDVPAGTLLPIEIQTTLSSATSREGDPVLAVLTDSVSLEGFRLDKGAEVRGRVRTVVAAKRVKGHARLVLDFEAVMKAGEKLSIKTEAFDSEAPSTAGKDKKIIGGSAAGGLVLGAIKGGKKGAAIGTILGAAAGGGAVLVMKGDEVELPRGARLTLTVK